MYIASIQEPIEVSTLSLMMWRAVKELINKYSIPLLLDGFLSFGP